MASASGWRKFVPIEVAPLIAAMAIVGGLASFRLYQAAKLPDVRITRFGGVHDWQDKLSKEDEEKKES